LADPAPRRADENLHPQADLQGGRVPAPELQAFVEQVFRRCGMEERDARLLAETLVTADLRGVHSHGVLRVPEYVRKLTRAGVDPIPPSFIPNTSARSRGESCL
jgi:LDH2 family malate/lactate/ureidoglycolate dehydrogenase